MTEPDTTAPRPETAPADDMFDLTPELFDRIAARIAQGDRAGLAALLDPLHAADIADLIEQLGPAERSALLDLWSGGADGEVLSELDDELRGEVIARLSPADLARAVDDLESDDVVDLVEDLEPGEKAAVLSALDPAERVAVERALAYPEESAGRLMQIEVVRAPFDWSVAQAIDFLRSGVALPDQFYHVILVDPRMRPVAYVTLGRVLSSPRSTRLMDITEDSFRPFEVNDDVGEVAQAFNRYHLISAPVVDGDGRLAGVITIDDAMIVLDDEHEEDMLRLAGVSDEASPSDGPLDTARSRLPWLVVNLFTASISAFVISRFEATIAALVTLAALMPIVASTGGIAGTQSLAVAVRALATRDLTASNARRVVRKEMVAGLLNGLGLALILALGAVAVFHDPMLGLVLGLAMIANQIVAALGGVLIPLGLVRLGFDPALASGTFVTTLTDVLGYLAFLGFATMLLL